MSEVEELFDAVFALETLALFYALSAFVKVVLEWSTGLGLFACCVVGHDGSRRDVFVSDIGSGVCVGVWLLRVVYEPS